MSNLGKAIWLEMMYQYESVNTTRDEWLFEHIYWREHY